MIDDSITITRMEYDKLLQYKTMFQMLVSLGQKTGYVSKAMIEAARACEGGESDA